MEIRRHDPWTDEENQILYDLAGKVSVEVIAIRTKRTESAVRNRARVLGISIATIYTDRRSWTDEETNYLLDHYQEMSMGQIGKHLKRSRSSVHERGRYLGLDMRLYGKKNHMTVNSEEDVELCRALFREGLSRRLIAEKMEVSYRCVCQYVSGRGRVRG